MGRQYLFRCTGCGYQAELSGGDDCGTSCRTATVECLQCRELFDVVTSRTPWKDVPHRPDHTLRCPLCRQKALRRWTHPGTCPICLRPVERLEATVCWD